MSSAAPATRVSVALKDLEKHFMAGPDKLVIMFQEICNEMLQAIMDNTWVQRNFTLSNLDGPKDIHTDIPGDSFVMRTFEFKAAPYFTLMMVSRDITIVNCFRTPLVSMRGRDALGRISNWDAAVIMMGRDALVVDIAIGDGVGEDHGTRIFRLCTTHDPPLSNGIANLLKDASNLGCAITGGIVGGDIKHELHKADKVDLRDAWEDWPPPPQGLRSKPGKMGSHVRPC
ncbi:MAG: hypothetical protein Q9221_002095 [Calogaya cf. arnoldii]